MLLHDGVLERFGSLKWWIQEFPANEPELLLSDLPIHREGCFNYPDFLIQLPLAPNRVFFGAASEQTEQILGQMAHADLIARINLTTLASSSKRLWAREARAREFVEANVDQFGKNVVPLGSIMPRLEQAKAKSEAVAVK